MSLHLKQFYEQEGMREAVREFMIAELRELAVERVFNKQTIAGIYEGRRVIDQAFNKLDEIYGKIQVKDEESEAR